jgi:hypothetical protein
MGLRAYDPIWNMQLAPALEADVAFVDALGSMLRTRDDQGEVSRSYGGDFILSCTGCMSNIRSRRY